MSRSPALRAKLAAQLEALETTARLARTREQLGQHAEQEELAEVWMATRMASVRLFDLVGRIAEAEQ